MDLLDTSRDAGVGQHAAGADDGPLDLPPVEQLCRQGAEHSGPLDLQAAVRMVVISLQDDGQPDGLQVGDLAGQVARAAHRGLAQGPVGEPAGVHVRGATPSKVGMGVGAPGYLKAVLVAGRAARQRHARAVGVPRAGLGCCTPKMWRRWASNMVADVPLCAAKPMAMALAAQFMSIAGGITVMLAARALGAPSCRWLLGSRGEKYAVVLWRSEAPSTTSNTRT